MRGGALRIVEGALSAVQYRRQTAPNILDGVAAGGVSELIDAGDDRFGRPREARHLFQTSPQRKRGIGRSSVACLRLVALRAGLVRSAHKAGRATEARRRRRGTRDGPTANGPPVERQRRRRGPWPRRRQCRLPAPRAADDGRCTARAPQLGHRAERQEAAEIRLDSDAVKVMFAAERRRLGRVDQSQQNPPLAPRRRQPVESGDFPPGAALRTRRPPFDGRRRNQTAAERRFEGRCVRSNVQVLPILGANGLRVHWV